MKLERCLVVALLATLLPLRAWAADGSNHLALMNGADFYFGGLFNPVAPVGTHGAWRCFPSDMLHAPTATIDPAGTAPLGTYATKITALHWTLTSSGPTITFPNVVLSSSDGDCRIAPGGTLNFGFMSSSAIGFPGAGAFAFGPLNSASGQTNLLAYIANVSFPNPGGLGTALGISLSLSAQPAAPSAIAVPPGESLVFWTAEGPQGPGNYQYYVGSIDERGVCSSLSFLASAIGPPGGAVFSGLGAVFGFAPQQFEHGMWIATKDATLTAAVSPSAVGSGAQLTQPGPFKIDIGTGARTLSLSGVTPEGGNGLGYERLFVHSFDAGNAFGGSKRMVFANVMGDTVPAGLSCGPWSPGYSAAPTGGPGGPVLSTAIPQRPRIVGKLDSLALDLLDSSAWLLATTHADVPGGAGYPGFKGFPALGGSSGNTGGFPIRIPGDPRLVGVELLLSSVGLDASGSAIAKVANNGHSHSNGFPVKFVP